MSSNNNQDYYEMPITPIIDEEGTSQRKDIQEDCNYNKTPTYNSSHSAAPPTTNGNFEAQPSSNMANMVSNQSSTTSYKSFSCKDRIAIIIINMFLLLFGISDIIMMKFFKFLG